MTNFTRCLRHIHTWREPVFDPLLGCGFAPSALSPRPKKQHFQAHSDSKNWRGFQTNYRNTKHQIAKTERDTLGAKYRSHKLSSWKISSTQIIKDVEASFCIMWNGKIWNVPSTEFQNFERKISYSKISNANIKGIKYQTAKYGKGKNGRRIVLYCIIIILST